MFRRLYPRFDKPLLRIGKGIMPLLLTAAALFTSSCSPDGNAPVSALSHRRQPAHSAPLSENIMRFTVTDSAASAGKASPSVLKRAAAETAQRGYQYFLLQSEQKTDGKIAVPHFSFSYGRNPYGFGDAGAIGGPAAIFSADPPNFSAHSKDKKQQTEWTVYMMQRADRDSVGALPLHKAELGKKAVIYNARNIAGGKYAKPVFVPLY